MCVVTFRSCRVCAGDGEAEKSLGGLPIPSLDEVLPPITLADALGDIIIRGLFISEPFFGEKVSLCKREESGPIGGMGIELVGLSRALSRS